MATMSRSFTKRGSVCGLMRRREFKQGLRIEQAKTGRKVGALVRDDRDPGVEVGWRALAWCGAYQVARGVHDERALG